ncbi:MAG: hypothetical protein V8S87_07430 [Oscillospiraceae bacterium]
MEKVTKDTFRRRGLRFPRLLKTSTLEPPKRNHCDGFPLIPSKEGKASANQRRFNALLIFTEWVQTLGSPFGRAVTAKSHKKAAVLPYPTHSGRTACPFCHLFTSDNCGAKKLSKLFYCQIKKTKCEGRTKKNNKNDRKCSKFAPCFFVQF